MTFLIACQISMDGGREIESTRKVGLDIENSQERDFDNVLQLLLEALVSSVTE